MKTIKLQIFEDFDSGTYGITHTNTISQDYGFNAFWNGIGIFHDVFEHSHEHTKYFSGDYAMNVGGEMAAMGAMWYFYNVLGVGDRLDTRGIFAPSDTMRRETENLITEAIEYGFCSFGGTLLSNVPKQSPVYDEEMEMQIQEMYKNIKDCKPDPANGEEDFEFGENYKKSVTFRKIADLHRYGFRQAEREIPDNSRNCSTLYGFLQFFNEFCKKITAEDIFNAGYKFMTFRLNKRNGFVSWYCDIEGTGLPKIRFNEDSDPDRVIQRIEHAYLVQ